MGPEERTRPARLPVFPTPFIGRERELDELTEMLAEPVCRLVALVGPGGAGKTRLAVEAARRYPGEVERFFVDLQPVESAAALPAALAAALSLPLSGDRPPAEQVVGALQSWSGLLVLDNFEHLLPAATFLSHVLQAAPRLTLLVTSRQALQLRSEWLYPVGGLPVPPDEAGPEAGAADKYAATRLFVTRARQIRPDFETVAEWDGVVRLCRLVGGLPLALELAAFWTRALPSATIADEVQDNLAFLSTTLRDVPERHRNMAAVFEQSWQRLGAEQQRAFARLSVFHGPFGADAAQAVGAASLATLAALVDRSLLSREAGGHYRLHPLLRQFAARKLAATPEEAQAARTIHTRTYAAFLAAQQGPLLGEGQLEALAEIERRLDNVRAAWSQALAEGQMALLQQMVVPLSLFFQFRSRYLEGAELFEAALRSVDAEAGEERATTQKEQVLVHLLLELAWLYIRLGRLEGAEALLQRSLHLYDRLQIPPVPGQATDPLLPLGVIALVRGDYDEAGRLAEQVVGSAASSGRMHDLSFAHYVRAQAAFGQGNFAAAEHNARAAHRLAREAGDRWFIAYCLNVLGAIAAAQGAFAAAERHYEAAYEIRRAFGDPEGMAVTLSRLGEAALARDEPERARRTFSRSVELYRSLDDRGGLAAALHGLGRAALAQNRPGAARRHLQQALALAAEIPFRPLALAIITSAAELLLAQAPELAAGWLAFVKAHPATNEDIRSRAERLLESRGAQPAEPGHDSLAGVIAGVAVALEERRAPELAPGEPTAGAAPPIRAEALTEREQEVLALLARGLTNREIAQRLDVVVGTIKAHNHNIYGKLNVDNRVEAVNKARELELL